jgi:uncharacterized protein (DUF58 family)
MPDREFHYRIPWYAQGHRPGGHRGTVFGSGLEFRGYAALGRAPDTRRLDVRATLADPAGQWQVRVYQQRASVPVFLIADVSASLRFPGKLELLAQFTASLAYSAHRTGDPWGAVVCDERVIGELLVPPTRARAAGDELAAQLSGLEPTGTSAEGLRQAVDYLGRRRALAFLASDFHFPLPLLEEVLESLAAHWVVPVVLWDRMHTDGAFEALPAWGLLRLQDAEDQRSRTMFLRPSLRRTWREQFTQRRAALTQCFARHGRQAFFTAGEFRPEAMTSYFFGAESAHERAGA